MLDFEALSGQSIVLLGQSKNFSLDEIEELLQLDKITIEKSVQKNSQIIVSGRLLNPHLEAERDALEKDPAFTVVDIETFEKALAASIHQEGLYLSLKLSHDNDRIHSYLCNTLISDRVFLNLLPLFNWEEETLFGNDANRDLCAALTRRFYPKVIQNHNIEYSPNGIHETVLSTYNSDLLDALLHIKPIQQGYRGEDKSIEHQILIAIAGNEAVSSHSLQVLAKHDDGRLAPLIAVSHNIDANTAALLYASQDPQVLVALGCNDQVDETLRVGLLQEANSVSDYIAEHAALTDAMFESILRLLPQLASIGKNVSLTNPMIERLSSLDDVAVNRFLAANALVAQRLLDHWCESSDTLLLASLALNPKLSASCFEKLSHMKIEEIDRSLAGNEATPVKILETLAAHSSDRVVKAIAANRSTPVDTLYQLLLDFRYASLVKANPSFGDNIRQEIGWES